MYKWVNLIDSKFRLILVNIMRAPSRQFIKLQINPIFKKPKDLTNVRIYKSRV